MDDNNNSQLAQLSNAKHALVTDLYKAASQNHDLEMLVGQAITRLPPPGTKIGNNPEVWKKAEKILPHVRDQLCFLQTGNMKRNFQLLEIFGDTEVVLAAFVSGTKFAAKGEKGNKFFQKRVAQLKEGSVVLLTHISTLNDFNKEQITTACSTIQQYMEVVAGADWFVKHQEARDSAVRRMQEAETEVDKKAAVIATNIAAVAKQQGIIAANESSAAFSEQQRNEFHRQWNEHQRSSEELGKKIETAPAPYTTYSKSRRFFGFTISSYSHTVYDGTKAKLENMRAEAERRSQQAQLNSEQKQALLQEAIKAVKEAQGETEKLQKEREKLLKELDTALAKLKECADEVAALNKDLSEACAKFGNHSVENTVELLTILEKMRAQRDNNNNQQSLFTGAFMGIHTSLAILQDIEDQDDWMMAGEDVFPTLQALHSFTVEMKKGVLLMSKSDIEESLARIQSQSDRPAIQM